MGAVFANFTVERLVTAVVVAILALAGWSYELERRKADKVAIEILAEDIKGKASYRDVERLEGKLDRLIEMHLEPRQNAPQGGLQRYTPR